MPSSSCFRCRSTGKGNKVVVNYETITVLSCKLGWIWFKTSPKLAEEKLAKFHPGSCKLRKLRVTEQQELGKKLGKFFLISPGSSQPSSPYPCSPFDPGRTWREPQVCKDTLFYRQFYVILYSFILNFSTAPALVQWTLQHTTVHGKIKVKYFEMGKKYPLKHTEKPLTKLPKHTLTLNRNSPFSFQDFIPAK